LEKSKSTVSSHLAKLTDAGLLEKNEVEGRKRVTYESTRKARSIVKGREKKVKFSLASSAVSLFAGIGLLGLGILPKFSAKSQSLEGADDSASLSAQDAANGSEDQGMSIMQEGVETAANKSADAGQYAAEKSAEAASSPEFVQPENVFLFVGVLFISTSVLSFSYGWIMNKLG
jgi:DNA-binding transcriptional ArsR family regulator